MTGERLSSIFGFQYQDILLEQDSSAGYKKHKRLVFLDEDPEADHEVLIERFDKDRVCERWSYITLPEGKTINVDIDQYGSNSTLGFCDDSSGERCASLYLYDSEIKIRGDFRQGKLLSTVVYTSQGILDQVLVYPLPRNSYKQIVAKIATERMTRKELTEQVYRELRQDRVVRDESKVMAILETAEVLNDNSLDEQFRTQTYLAIGGFVVSNTDYCINLDGQTKIPYNQEVNFYERLVQVTRTLSYITVKQRLSMPGVYPSCEITAPLSMPSDRIAFHLFTPDRSWKDFFDEMGIKGEVTVSR